MCPEQTALRRVTGEHADASEESKLLEKEAVKAFNSFNCLPCHKNYFRLFCHKSIRCCVFQSSWRRVKGKLHGLNPGYDTWTEMQSF